LIVVDHGSRRPEANAQLEELARRLSARLGEDIVVEIAHLEIAPPTIADALRRCVERGATDVVVHPFMLTPGRHATEDIPRLAHEAAQAFPELRVRVTEPLGLDDAVVDGVLNRSGFRPKP
jgi:sirohydrochlorin ferrochelatase